MAAFVKYNSGIEALIEGTQASVRRIVVRKPDGKRVTWAALQDGTTAIKYITAPGD